MIPPQPTRRRWFQIHLSTVVALTLTAGAILFLNMEKRASQWWDGLTPFAGTVYGWPFNCYIQEATWGVLHGGSLDEPEWSFEKLAANILSSFLILVWIGLLSELVLNTKEREPEKIRKSTALILTLVAMCQLYANIHEWKKETTSQDLKSTYVSKGFPCEYYVKSVTTIYFSDMKLPSEGNFEQFSWSWLVADFALCALILTLVFILLERRKRIHART
ncbi:MAG TPA: hypothetical protein VEK08_15255 [Planctomycetota bacterium]|nr:hypothetical protein [Planctomycetota bacterium]